MFAVYSFAGTISAAIPGLSALGVAAAGGVGALAGMKLSARDRNTLPNLSRYFAFACDAFGIPRVIKDKENVVEFGLGDKKSKCKLPDPKIPDPDPGKPACCPLDDIRLWEKTDTVDRIRELISHE